ncbi:hypothetical protein BT69DRAFT_1346340 [Atractiella rhizophila]|nr:hypothetical protein BT69DRAFT_1346340 [Atractiella rhizophila]
MPPKFDLNKAGFEESEFPILCETCLGDNPYVRMSKQNYGGECKICTRPFTVFRWLPGSGMRYKKTEICQTCSKTKNVCQTCLLDLQFGLPVQVRDTALGLKNQAPTSDINREYFAQNMDGKVEANTSQGAVSFGKADSAGKELLKKLARTDPYYKRNRPHLCSFYAKGACMRGDECPYRHELPIENELSKQNIKDRYYGTNDPVARKILSSVTASKSLTPPDDKSITSLFLSSLPPDVTESEIRTHYVQNVPDLQPHNIKSIVLVPASNCAFVNFSDRKAAESAATRSAVEVVLGGKAVKVSWGRSRKGPVAGVTKPVEESALASTEEAEAA